MSFKAKLFVAQADMILLTQVYRKGEYTHVEENSALW